MIDLLIYNGKNTRKLLLWLEKWGMTSCVEKRVMWWGKGVVSCRFMGVCLVAEGKKKK
jgi:hypothetical protein